MAGIVVVGGSAGSIEPLRQVIAGLPWRPNLAVLVVVHTMANAPSVLPRILTKAGAWSAEHAVDGQLLKYGSIYVAPPDHHLSMERETLRVSRGPKENSHRPAIDPLFRTAARYFGPAAIGVLLSGNGADGSSGLLAIRHAGGKTVVQDPEEALFPTMLRKAIELLQPDVVAPASDIGAVIMKMEEVASMAPEWIMPEENSQQPPEGDIEESGRRPSPYSCPECGGVLWEEDDDQLFGYRCRVGHVYSYDALIGEQTESIERALWAGLRAIEEKQSLLERLAKQSQERRLTRSAERFEGAAKELEEPASTFRHLLDHRHLYDLPQREESEPL
jgi:two-component system, chemotaxis family, protein-glutamate methylesterase/glutaminase